MICEYCHDEITWGDKFYHIPDLNINFHLGCEINKPHYFAGKMYLCFEAQEKLRVKEGD